MAAITCKGKLIVLHLKSGDETFAALSTLGMTGWWVEEFDVSKEELVSPAAYKIPFIPIKKEAAYTPPVT